MITAGGVTGPVEPYAILLPVQVPESRESGVPNNQTSEAIDSNT